MIWLVFMDNGQLFGSYFDEQRANGAADAINGVVVGLAITTDYRE